MSRDVDLLKIDVNVIAILIRLRGAHVPTAAQTEDAAESVSRTAVLGGCLDSLDDRQRRVLELRYGLGGGRPRTLDEIGLVFNVTRERIRQIETQSLNKLAALAEAQQLRQTARNAPSPLPRAV